jgi:hypothetical protein
MNQERESDPMKPAHFYGGGWEPIATAPKDGSVILAVHNRGTWVYPKDPRRINCVVVFWDGRKFNEFGPDSFTERELAYWQPLPEPPRE